MMTRFNISFKRLRLKIILQIFTILATLLIISLGILTFSLNQQMTEMLAQKRLLQPTEYFSTGLQFSTQQKWQDEVFKNKLLKQNYRERSGDQLLLPGDFLFADQMNCQQRLGRELPENALGCLVIVSANATPHWIFHNGIDQIVALASGANADPTDSIQLEPRRFAQYLGSEPLMQENITLSNVPTMCLHALLSIEDQKFLEHSGFSLSGLGRAVFRNVIQGRKAQGGSTITQQLVKNYFLSSEKSYERKIKELIMAVLLETRFTKDEILETYLNVIYMGQHGAFRVHGYASASSYYFSKPLETLDLAECALMAALVNNPGGLNPWKKSDAAIKRRALVLQKMTEQNQISPSEETQANAHPLPPPPSKSMATETAPYFIDAVRRQAQSLHIDLTGLRVETSLDLDAQQLAQDSLQNHLVRLETTRKGLKATGVQKQKNLEGMVLSADVKTGLIGVAVGGRSFRKTQFNRAVDSRRQVGSIMKPLVYLTGLMQPDEEGKPRSPTTILPDEKKTYKYEGQSWSPDNYDKVFRGQLPMFAALKDSVNAPTVALGMSVGLEKIIQTARQFGVQSPLKPVPSVTLGAFEMTAPEVLSIAIGIANLGAQAKLSFIKRIYDQDGKMLFEHHPDIETVAPAEETAELVGMMKQSFIFGTATSAKAWGFTAPAAGKTGTTNGERDTWFMGFTPHRAAVVWVGFDDGSTTHLTGASGALPVWATFMSQLTQNEIPQDFPWPEGTKIETYNHRDLENWGIWKDGAPESIDLILKKNL